MSKTKSDLERRAAEHAPSDDSDYDSDVEAALLPPGADVEVAPVEAKNPEETAGPIGFVTFGWLDGLIKTCYAKENPKKNADGTATKTKGYDSIFKHRANTLNMKDEK